MAGLIFVGMKHDRSGPRRLIFIGISLSFFGLFADLCREVTRITLL
jgi:hypothetical protein